MRVIPYKKTYLYIGAFIVVASVAILAVLGLRFGIDFTGGALMEAAYPDRPDKAAVEERLGALDLGGYSLRESENENNMESYVLRTRALSEEERLTVQDALSLNGEVAIELGRYTSIGPVIGEELRRKAVWAIALVVLVIVLYVAFAFRGVARPVRSWVYGLISVFVLLHDVLVPAALFAVLGHFLGAEVDVLFVMAMLAVLGYSVNDTIVVLDRVRENLRINQESERVEPFSELVDRSLNQMWTRSINTSLTTLLALVGLFILGGDVTKNFSLVLITGILAGTYSSLFIAPPLLVAVEEWQRKRAGAK